MRRLSDGQVSAVLAALCFAQPVAATELAAGRSPALRIASRDGTPIAVACTGSGPELLIVHGGAGDRTRWTPIAALLARDFTVCAMDRRAHGESGDGPSYSLEREVDDVVAVVASRKAHVTVLGHSFGGVVAYQAALRSRAIARLILYEPPIRVGDHAAAIGRIERALLAGDRDGATTIFMRDIVQVSPAGLDKMRAQPSWPALVETIGISVRQDRALTAYRWRADRARQLHVPVLLLIGSLTQSPDLQQSVAALDEAVPDSRVIVLPGQEHNAMDEDRDNLARIVRDFMPKS